jgi:hypothetical protein
MVAPHTYLVADDPSALPRALLVWIWLGLSALGALNVVRVVWQRDWPNLALASVGIACIAGSWTMTRLLPCGAIAWLFTTGIWLARTERLLEPRPRQVMTAAAGLLAVALSVARVVLVPAPIAQGDRFASAQPAAAARFVQEHDLPQPIFNDYLTGGYLIWALGPEYPVFIDPRFRPYDPILRATYFAFEREPSVEELEALTENAGLRTAVVRTRGWQGRLCMVFGEAPSWQLLFVGRNAAVYVHRDAVTKELAKLAQTPEVAPGLKLARDPTVHAGAFRALVGVDHGRVLRFFREFQRHVPDYKYQKKGVASKYLDYFEQIAFSHGQKAGERLSPAEARQRFAMYYLNGEIDIARAVATGYLGAYPEDARMQYNLACVEARAGDLVMAAEALAAALRHGYDRLEAMQRDPDLAPLRETAAYERLLAKWSRTVAAAAIVGGASGGTR